MSDETLVADPVQGSAALLPLYSPAQTAWGMLLGGPAAVVYFLYRNYIVLGDVAAARKTVNYGVAVILAYFGVVALLPAHALPNGPFTVASWFVTRGIVESMQPSTQAIIASPVYTFHSGWRVLGMSILCAIVTAIGLFAAAFAWAFFQS